MRKIIFTTLLVLLVLTSNAYAKDTHLPDKNYPVYENVYYTQGDNDFNTVETCGAVALANAFNIVTGTKAYTENEILHWCIDEGFCSFNENMGLRMGSEFVLVIDHTYKLITEDRPYDFLPKNLYLSGDYYKCPEESRNECAYRIAENFALYLEEALKKHNGHAAAYLCVSPEVLFSDKEVDVSRGDNAWSHAIVVVKPLRDEDGKLTGFSIVDSGGQRNFVDPVKLVKMTAPKRSLLISKYEKPQENSNSFLALINDILGLNRN